MHAQSAHFARTHGIPKIHKTYSTLLPFWPIIDTNTPHYSVAKFLSSLLNPLTLNEYVLTDFSIQNIPQQLYCEGY